jgi:hypothetical protein
LEVLDMLLQDLFGAAMQADKKARLRSLKDLDSAAITLAEACHFLLDPTLPDSELRTAVFTRIPPNMLAQALGDVGALTRPPARCLCKSELALCRSAHRAAHRRRMGHRTTDHLPHLGLHLRSGTSAFGSRTRTGSDLSRRRGASAE